MKNLLIVIITCLTFCSAKSQTIDGQFNDITASKMIYITYYPDLMGYQHEGILYDSSTIKNGRFHFNFKVGEVPKLAKLIQMERNKITGEEEYLGEIRFFVANDSIVIFTSDSLKNTKVLNSAVNYDAALIDEMTTTVNEKILDLYEKQRMENNEIASEISRSVYHTRYDMRKMKSLSLERAAIYNKFIRDNPYSWISLYIFIKNLGQNSMMITPEIAELYNGLGTKLKMSELGIDLAKRIEAKNKVRNGAQAPLFQLRDTSGNVVKLSDYRGKYVLLEFWASWCGGCRFEAPFLKMAYSKFKKSGFEILSVSLDEDGLKRTGNTGRKDWLIAISQDGTGLWKHVSDLKGVRSLVPVMYDIQSIPQNYLIDPTGKIISENLKGADLLDKLEDIFYK